MSQHGTPDKGSHKVPTENPDRSANGSNTLFDAPSRIRQSVQPSVNLIRVVLTGSESTGKSTLAAALEAHFGVTTVPEYLRSYFEANNGVLTLDDAIPVAKGQIVSELAAEERTVRSAMERGDTAPQLMLFDTNLVSSVVYNRYYYGENPEWIEEALAARHYDHYLMCDTDIPWTPDGQRDRPDDRETLQALFVAELQKRKLPFTVIRGTREERAKKAVAVIEGLLKA